MLGGAVGDALGYEVEFESLERIRERFGEGGIRDFVSEIGYAMLHRLSVGSYLDNCHVIDIRVLLSYVVYA